VRDVCHHSCHQRATLRRLVAESTLGSQRTFLSADGAVLSAFGRASDAIREGERVIHIMPVSKDAIEGPLMLANLARIYVLLGEREKAIDQLELVLSRPGPLSANWLKADPFWDPVRTSPRFQQLAAARN